MKSDFKENNKLYDILRVVADSAIAFQNEDGSFPSGHNGDKMDSETAVRNTCHWVITLSQVYKDTSHIKYKKSILRAFDYLLSKEVRPMDATFWHRKNPEKDFCNGVIGQAYTIEALATIYDVLRIEKAKILAEELFLLHPFVEESCLWRSVSVDGSFLDIDCTFNHQLWFAVSGAILWKVGKNEEVGKRVNKFIEKLGDNMEVHAFFKSGLIFHLTTKSYIGKSLKNKMKRIFVISSQYSEKEIIKATGYHLYNLWAFSILKNCFPDIQFWESKKFKSTLTFINSKSFIKVARKYNFSEKGSRNRFENLFIQRAHVVFAFEDSNDKIIKIESLLSKQFEKEFDLEFNMLNKYAIDKNTQAARIYEATRLPNVNISFKNIIRADV